MKLFVILIFCTAFFLHAAPGYSQEERIHLTIKNVKISEVLKEIERQTNYLFFYNHTEIGSERAVSFDAANVPLNSLLNQIFKNTDVNFTIVDKHIVLTKNKELANLAAVVQGAVITGLITDASGEPMPGVNVLIKGTTTGVVTDVYGKYTIPVPNTNTVLQFSFIGYATQEITVADQKVINITLAEDITEIAEVVVVGYGTMRKSDLTGTIVRADINAFAESPNTSIVQSLQGSVPGLNVGQVKNAGEEPSMSIRGRNTMSGSTSPLIVLDGIIFRGSLIDINPHDIQSIDILKDASATAIYGSQASNGVMLITSKEGKDTGKPVINYNGSVTWQYPTTKKFFPSDRQGFLDLIAATFLTESRTGADLMTPNPAWNPVLHLMDNNAVNGYNNNIDTDWWGMLTHNNGFIQDHSLGVRGKNNMTGYYFSIGYTDQQNIIVNDQFKRYSVRINLDSKITDWFKVGVQSFLSVSDKPGNIPGDINGIIPIVAARNAQDEPIIYPYMTTLNPLLQQEIDRKDNRVNIFANFYADINIPFIQGLNYRLNFGQNLRNTREYQYNPWGSNLEGSGYKNYGNQYDWTVDNILSYKRQFREHNINATLVYGLEERKYDNTSASAQKFVNDALGYNYLQGGQADLQRASSGGWDESSIYSMFRLFYSFKNRYMFTGTVRRDGFSGFGANNKFAVFPSVALAWVASEESFVKDNVLWLNNLKLRLSHGYNGNRAISRYQTLSRVNADHRYLYGDGSTPVLAQYISTLPNSDLKWEKTISTNIGLDFSVLRSRLFGTLDIYTGKTNDMLYEINIPRINGVSSVWTNLGEMTNHGQELTLTGIPVDKGDLRWTVTFNFSRNRNKVVTILGFDNDGDGKEDDLTSGGRSNSIFIGEPYGVWYDFNINGMWQMGDNIPSGFYYGTYKVEDVNDDGSITSAKDRKLIGYKDPSYRYGIQSSLQYKGFEFKFFINSIQGGNKYYKGYATSGWPEPENVYKTNTSVWDWWMPENPDAKFRRLGAASPIIGVDCHPLSNRSFVRLQDVTLSYTFSPKILDKIGLKMLKLYVSGKNLATWTNWEGWDPETGQGFYSGQPVMKSYSVGINVEF